MAGIAGFEPAHHGVKFRSLTELGYIPMLYKEYAMFISPYRLGRLGTFALFQKAFYYPLHTMLTQTTN